MNVLGCRLKNLSFKAFVLFIDISFLLKMPYEYLTSRKHNLRNTILHTRIKY